MIYNLIACAGTFDRLHPGHKKFLKNAFKKGKNIVVGITSDEYIKKNKNNKNVQNYKIREENIENFLKEQDFLKKSKIIKIEDAFGPMLDSSIPFDAIVVTEETKKAAENINALRENKNLSRLSILVVPLLRINGEIISSTKIRKKENSLFLKTLILPEEVRSKLKKPFGKVLRDLTSLKMLSGENIATVGDVTSSKFHKLGINQKVSVIDFKVERKKTSETLNTLGFSGKEIILFAKNPAGQISLSLWDAIQKVIKNINSQNNFIICVSGEEDLAVLPLAMLLPIGYKIFYGQPGEGIVRVCVDRSIKIEINNLIRLFK